MSSKRKSLVWMLFLLAAVGWAQVPPRPPVGPAAAARPGTPGGEARGEPRTTVWRGREVTYRVIDGWAVHDGDILLGRVEEIEAPAGGGDIEGRRPRPGLRRDASAHEDNFWPGGIIPYEIVEDATDEERAEVQAAMAEWEARTPITFVPRNGEPYYASLRRWTDGGRNTCWSTVGPARPAVVYTVGCPFGLGVIVHELGHLVGLLHEFQRADRDEYLMIPTDRATRYGAFRPVYGPFDYRSIMHAVGGLLSIPPGMPAGSLERPEGVLSVGDVAGVSRLYGQPSAATVITTNPPGLEVVVDGFRVTAPATFHWPTGSTHVLEAPLWQTGPEWSRVINSRDDIQVKRHLFGRWSDSGKRVHEFTARPGETWVAANFIVQRGYEDSADPHSLSQVFPPPGYAKAFGDGFETFDVTPRALSFVSAPGSDLPAGTIRLTNRADGPERYRIVSDSRWLLAEPAEAGLAPGESVDIEVRALREGLRHDAYRGELRVRPASLDAAQAALLPGMPVAFVVLPEMEAVPLGSAGETLEVAVSETEGYVGVDGRPLGRDDRVKASNGDLYRLEAGPGGIAARFEPRSESLDLPGGGTVTLQQSAEGNWRIGEDHVESGHRYTADGHEYTLEMVDARWRVAPYAVRTVWTGSEGSVSDGIPAVEADVRPAGIAVDAAGNVYIGERTNLVRKIDAAGTITTVAGTGSHGYLVQPDGVAVDAAGNVYVTDGVRLRKIDAAGVITTVAGTGERGYSGDGGPATAAQLAVPWGLALDASGNLYVADSGNSKVRKIDAGGVITRVAGIGRGPGPRGDGVAAEAARDSIPRGLAVDADGNLYVADYENQQVLRIDAKGKAVLRTAGGASDVAVGPAGNVYVADPENRRVLKIDPAGTRTSIAGLAEWEHFDRSAVGPSGSLYVAEYQGVLRIDPAGTSTSLHSPYPFNYGPVAVDAEGRVLTAAKHRLVRTEATGTSILARLPTDQIVDIALDGHGNIYACGIALHQSGHWQAKVWKVDSLGGWHRVDAGHPDLQFNDLYDPYAALDAAWRGCAVDGSGRIWIRRWSGERERLRVLEPQPVPPVAAVKLPGGGVIRLTRRDDGSGWHLGDEPVRSGYRYVQGSTKYVLVRVGEQWRVTGVSVPLAAGGGTVEFAVLADGSLFHEPTGRPVADGSQYTDPNFDTYTLTVGPGGIAATLVPRRSQTVELERGGSLHISQDQNGIWRWGGTVVESGQEIVRNGLGYRFETRQGRWQVKSLGPLYSIRTVAGSTAVAEGVPATAAGLYRPGGIAVDAIGNVVVADTWNHRIRRVDLSGVIQTVAGSGEAGYGGDGGPATEARLLFPQAVAVDATGGIYVADTGNDRVRRISAAGTITTLAGGGSSVQGVPATEAGLDEPTGVAVDTMGNLYVAQRNAHRVSKIDSAGTITTLAGAGLRDGGGDGGPATEARLWSPHGVAADAAGNVYVTTGSLVRKIVATGIITTVTTGSLVRKIDATGIITTVAGGGRGGDGGLATEAELRDVKGVAVDSAGSVYVADSYYDRVRRIDAQGVISTVAGTGRAGFGGDGKAATEARLDAPEGVAADAAGNVYVADTGNHRVRRVDTAGTITTLAGTVNPVGGWAGGPAGQARLLAPASIAVDAAGNVLFADRHRVWKLDASGMVTVVAGTGEPGSGGDGGPATEARLADPEAVAVDISGNVYVADRSNLRVRRIDTAGIITTVAGGGTGGDGGQATEAFLGVPRGVAVDSAGNLYLAHGDLVRKVDISGIITTVAGGGSNAESEPDGRAAVGSYLLVPTAGAVDTQGNLFIFDSWGARLRKVDAAAGTISTLLEGDIAITAVTTDLSGNVFVAMGHQIRRMDADGSVWVIAGTGEQGFNGDGSRATDAELSVSGLAVDRSGSVWFSDPVNRRIRVLDPAR